MYSGNSEQRVYLIMTVKYQSQQYIVFWQHSHSGDIGNSPIDLP